MRCTICRRKLTVEEAEDFDGFCYNCLQDQPVNEPGDPTINRNSADKQRPKGRTEITVPREEC